MAQSRMKPRTLAKYAKLARPILINVAKNRDTITYDCLSGMMGGKPGARRVGEVLDHIDESGAEVKLSALVVRVDTQKVGGGFFGLPGTPPRLLRRSRKKRRNPILSDADETYWRQQLALVYQYYRSASISKELSHKNRLP